MIPNQKSKDANPCNILHKLGRFYKIQSLWIFFRISSILPNRFVAGVDVNVVVLHLINLIIIGQGMTRQQFSTVNAPKHGVCDIAMSSLPTHLLQQSRPQTAQFLTGTLRNTNDRPHWHSETSLLELQTTEKQSSSYGVKFNELGKVMELFGKCTFLICS